MTRAVVVGAIGLLCALAAAAPASAAKRRAYAFEITSVSMSEVMSFHGDGGPACERAGVCGYSGTVSYSFSAGDGLAAFLISGRRVHATGDFFYAGLTSASVQTGPGPPCSDKLLQGFDGFEVAGRPNALRLLFHPPIDRPDYLHTLCGGPSDLDMWHAGAIPSIAVTERSLRRRSFRLRTSSTRPFHAGPFEGTLAFSVDMRLRRERHIADTILFLSDDL